MPAARLYRVGARPTPAMEEEFFQTIRLPNGTFKTTADRRLDDLNVLVSEHLPARRPLRVKDVAVSSGISTVEWHEALTRAGIASEVTATDLLVHARLVTIWPGIRFLLDRTRRVLQLDIASFAFTPSEAPRKRRVCAPLLAIARRPRLLRSLARAETPVQLVSPRLLGNGNVRVVEEDLTSPRSGEWDVIRAANILHFEYFSERTIRTIVHGLCASLSSGGILIVCRTTPAAGNEASIFRRCNGRMELVAELNGGSEIAAIVRAEGEASA